MKKGITELLPRGWKKVCFGIGIGMLAMLIVTGLSAWLIEREVLDTAYMNIAASAALLIGSFLGALSSGRGEGALVRVLCVGAGMVLLLLLINIVFYSGSLGGLIPGVVVVSGGCVAAAMTSGGRPKRRKNAYRKYRNR